MEKNFLETVSNEYPSSFAEEKFVQNKRSYKGLITGLIIVFIVFIIGLLIYLKINKKVTMKNFVGEPKETLNIWLKENGISNKNVIITYEYDSVYDENIIIDQNVLEGTKIKKSKVLNFTLSKGADPDELIKFPDLNSMDYDDIKKWITDNKLTNVKVNQEYNDKFEKNALISYKLKNIEESEFKRSSNLTIVISKGSKPKNEVVMENFVGKSSEYLLTWASQNKIEVNTSMVFSNREAGEIVYQSVPAGDSIGEGDTLSVSVSKGQGITVPYFIGKKKSYAASYASTNDILITYNEVYSTSEKNTIIDQSIASNSLIGAGDTLVLTVSLGKPYISNYIGEDINELLAWIEEVNSSGCNISLQINEKKYYSDTVKKDAIIAQNKVGYINLTDTINVSLSLGSKVLVDKDYVGLDETDVKLFCADLNCIYDYKKSSSPIGTVIDIRIGDKKLVPDMYINSSDLIVVTISEGA